MHASLLLHEWVFLTAFTDGQTTSVKHQFSRRFEDMTIVSWRIMAIQADKSSRGILHWWCQMVRKAHHHRERHVLSDCIACCLSVDQTSLEARRQRYCFMNNCSVSETNPFVRALGAYFLILTQWWTGVGSIPRPQQRCFNAGSTQTLTQHWNNAFHTLGIFLDIFVGR